MILLEVCLVYAGLSGAALGLVALVRPFLVLRIRTRRAAGRVALLGAASLAAGFALPAHEMRVAKPAMQLDEIVPICQFWESHESRVRASPARVYAAIKAVTASEIRLFRLLTWIRSPSLPGTKRREHILDAPADKPILQVALASGFLLLAEEPDREIVFGTLVCCGQAPVRDPTGFIALDRPGYAKAVMNFAVRGEGDGSSHLTTQTRVFATDAATRRRFAVYWRLIYPGSALIRRMWLEAIKERAEAAT